MKFFLIFGILASILMIISMILSKKSWSDKEKSSSFECGFDPYLSSRSPFSLRFFKIAIIFLIFDIEIVLIMPVPLVNYSINAMTFYSIFTIFIIILMGLYFEWNQGSLEWVK